MKLRITGYMLVVIGFGLAMTIIWPSLYGKYSFMPPQEYRIPKDTGEMVSANAVIMHGQTVLQICLDKQAKALYPILMMFFGAIVLDIAGRNNCKSSSEVVTSNES